MLSRTLGETLKVNGITLMKMVLPLQVLKLSMVKNFTFNEDGSQVKGGVVKNADGTYSKYKRRFWRISY